MFFSKSEKVYIWYQIISKITILIEKKSIECIFFIEKITENKANENMTFIFK